jgi:hypothetical protein
VLEIRRAVCEAQRMPTCAVCKDEVDEVVTAMIGGKRKKVCEDCGDRAKESEAIAQESESVVQNMMGFKGRR